MNKYCYNALIGTKKYERTFKYNDMDMLILSIKYPIVTIKYNPYAERLINSQITMKVNDFIRLADYMYKQAVDSYHNSQKNDIPFNTFGLYMDYNVTYNQNCFLSIYFDNHEYTGGAHGGTIRSSETWELCSGMRIPLYSLFKPGTDYKLLLTGEIMKQAESYSRQNPGMYFEEYKSLIIKNFNEQSYYLTPEGLKIYYQQYDIGAYVIGIVEFTIPYETIGWHPEC